MMEDLLAGNAALMCLIERSWHCQGFHYNRIMAPKFPKDNGDRFLFGEYTYMDLFLPIDPDRERSTDPGAGIS